MYSFINFHMTVYGKILLKKTLFGMSELVKNEIKTNTKIRN